MTGRPTDRRGMIVSRQFYLPISEDSRIIIGVALLIVRRDEAGDAPDPQQLLDRGGTIQHARG